MTRILIAGGYGVVGAWIARELRAAHPDVELVLGGRNPDRGAALAAEVGARAVRLDVVAPDAGLTEAGNVDLVIGALQDPGCNLTMAALKRGAGYTSVAWPPDVMGAVVIAAQLAGRPALVLGHWQAGVMSLCALNAAKAFGVVDRIELAGLYDSKDPVGPMTTSDAGGFFESGALVRVGGAFAKVSPAEKARMVERGNALAFGAQPMTVYDVPGLAGVTGAPDIRFDLGSGESLGTLSGQGASHEIYIDLWGRDASGKAIARRTIMSDPKGQAHLTALGVVIGAERMLGLDGKSPLPGGLTFPEAVIDPEAAMRRLQAFGVTIETVPLSAV